MELPANAFKARARRKASRRSACGSASPIAYVAEIARDGGLRLAADRRRARAQRPAQRRSRSCRRSRPIRSHPVVRAGRRRHRAHQAMLDIGAQTLLIPMVETAEQAAGSSPRRAIRPRGMRGVGRRWRARRAGTASTDYLHTADDDICVLRAGRVATRPRRARSDRRGRWRRRRVLRTGRPVGIDGLLGHAGRTRRAEGSRRRHRRRARRGQGARASSRPILHSRAATSRRVRCSSPSASTRDFSAAARARSRRSSVAVGRATEGGGFVI